MPVVNTLPKLPTLSSGPWIGSKGLGTVLKPVVSGGGPIRDPMADLKRELGTAVSTLAQRMRVGLAHPASFSLHR